MNVVHSEGSPNLHPLLMTRLNNDVCRPLIVLEKWQGAKSSGWITQTPRWISPVPQTPHISIHLGIESGRRARVYKILLVQDIVFVIVLIVFVVGFVTIVLLIGIIVVDDTSFAVLVKHDYTINLKTSHGYRA